MQLNLLLILVSATMPYADPRVMGTFAVSQIDSQQQQAAAAAMLSHGKLTLLTLETNQESSTNESFF